MPSTILSSPPLPSTKVISSSSLIFCIWLFDSFLKKFSPRSDNRFACQQSLYRRDAGDGSGRQNKSVRCRERVSLLRLHPGLTDAYIDFQRRVKLPGAGHLAAGEFGDGGSFRLGGLEDQLIVDLKDQARGQAFRLQGAIGIDHSDFHDIRGAALDDRVDRQALAQFSHAVLGGAQLGDQAAAAQHGDDKAVFSCLLDNLVAEGGDFQIASQVGLDVARRLLLGDPQLLGESVGADTVHDAEVDRLGAAALGAGHILRLEAEDLGRRVAVDILTGGESLAQFGLRGKVGHNAQLHLGVVGDYEPRTLLGNEAVPDLFAQRRADGDVLQVRIAGGDAAGSGHRLVEGRVEAPGVGVGQPGKRLEVGSRQLGQLAVGLDLFDDRVPVPQVLEDGGVGGITGFGLFPRRQPQFFKQDGGELLGRVDVEIIFAGELVDLVAELVEPVGYARSQLAQAGQVDADADALHAGQNADQRHFNGGEELSLIH